MLCDRKTTNVAKSQVGFIDFVVKPYFMAIAQIMPDMQYAVNQMISNKNEWMNHVEEYENQMIETGNEKM